MSHTRIILFSFFVLILNQLSGQTQFKTNPTKVITKSSPASATITMPTVSDFRNLTGNLDYNIQGARLIVRFSSTDNKGNYNFSGSGAYVQQTMTIKTYDQSSNLLNVFKDNKHTCNAILNVNDETPAQSFYVDFTSSIAGGSALSTDLTSFNIDFGGLTPNYGTIASSLLSSYDNSLVLEYWLEFDIGIKANASSPVMLPKQIGGATYVSSSRNVLFEWTNGSVNNYKYSQYQLEVVKIINSTGTGTDPQKIEGDLDWSKALRIETSLEQHPLNALNLSINQGTGYYAWRIRPVGSFYSGGSNNPLNLGQWSSTASGQVALLTGADVKARITNYYTANNGLSLFYLEDPDENNNHIRKRIFTEGNKIKEVTQYADALGNLLQSQSYLPSEGVTVITENIIDFSGRPAISTLPVPVGGKITSYQSDFTKNVSSKKYSAADFDKNADAGVIKDQGTAQAYYNGTSAVKSNSGKNQYVPDAEGYLFTQTKFTNDATGRVSERGAAGDVMSMAGTDKKTTKYYYSSPSETELRYLFGKEAPMPHSIIKEVVVDGNGTSNISYKNKSGKVVATAIAYESTNSPLYPIDNDLVLEFDGLTDATSVSSLMHQNFKSNNGLESIKKLALFQTSNKITMDYTLDCNGLGSCVDVECEYDVEIKVFDIDNHELLFKFHKEGLTCGAAPTSMFEEINSPNTLTPLECSLPAGNYMIVKSLKLSNDPNGQGLSAGTDFERELGRFVGLIRSWIYSPNFVGYPELADKIDQIIPYDPLIISGPELTEFFDNNYIDNIDAKKYVSAIRMDQDPNGEDFYLVMETTCCGTLKVDLNWDPGFKCSLDWDDFAPSYIHLMSGNKVDEDLADDLNPMDFEGYFYLKTQYDATAANHATLFPGYRRGDFNYMVYRMLTDEYFIGKRDPMDQTKVHPSATERTKWDNWHMEKYGTMPPDYNVTTFEEVQYKCEDLWKCWLAIVADFVNVSTATAHNGRVGDNEQPGADNEKDNVFDNMDIPDFLKGFFGSKTGGQKMEDQNNLSFTLRAPQLLLQCAGCKYAEVLTLNQPVDPNTNLATAAGTVTVTNPRYPDDFAGGTNPPPLDFDESDGTWNATFNHSQTNRTYSTDAATSPYFTASDIWDGTSKRFKLKNIYDPVYAFKYMVYRPGAAPSCEKDNCYTSNGGVNVPCVPVSCPEGYNAWDAEAMCSFYQCVSNYVGELVEVPGWVPPTRNCTSFPGQYTSTDWNIHPLSTSPPPTIPSTYTWYDKYLVYHKKMDDCKSDCEERRSYFRLQLFDHLREQGYSLEGCGDDVVPMADIELILDKLIGDCKLSCNLTMPTCSTYTGCNPPGSVSLIEYDQCEMIKIEQWTYWHLDLSGFFKPGNTLGHTSPSCINPQPCSRNNNSSQSKISVQGN